MKKEICKICEEEAVQIFNIKGKEVVICEACERRIVKQSIDFVYNISWKLEV